MATRNQVDVSLSGQTGTGSFVGATSPTLTTPTLGVASATSLNLGGTALANYLEGTWTPTLSFATPGNLSVVYTTQAGSYTRIGNIVFLEFTLACTPTFTTATGSLRIAGFVINSARSNCAGQVGVQGSNFIYGASKTHTSLSTTNGQSFLSVIAMGSAIASAAIGTGSFASGVAVSIAGSIAFNV